MATMFDVGQKLNKKEVEALLDQYFYERGIDPSYFPKGKVITGDDPATLRECGIDPTMAKGRPFLLIPYVGPDGECYFDPSFVSPTTGQPVPFIQARFLGPIEPRFAREGLKPTKMGGQKRGNELFFAPIHNDFSWKNIPVDVPIVIVESAVKAMKVAKDLGLPCIGVGGVSNYKSTERGREFIFTEYGIEFRERRIIVLYDANHKEPDIAAAIEDLCSKFKYKMECKDVRIAYLPPIEGLENPYKGGPDDYIQKYGADALGEVILAAKPYEGSPHGKLVEQIQSRAIYCTRNNVIVDLLDNEVRDVAAAKVFYAPYFIQQKSKTVFALDEWLKTKGRNEVVSVEYAYLGEPTLVIDGEKYHNLYRPKSGIWLSGPRPDPELVAPLVRHFKAMLGENYPRVMSYMKFVKYSGKRPNTYMMFVSDERGVGKSFMIQILRVLMGRHNATNISNSAFQSKFNGLFQAKRFVSIEELNVGPKEKREVIVKIKEMIGNDSITIEKKGKDAIEITSSFGMMVSTNTIDELPIDTFADRRTDIIECKSVDEALLPDGTSNVAYWTNLRRILTDLDIQRAFLAEIEAAEDMPFESLWAPVTDFKREATRRSMTPRQQAAVDALDFFQSVEPKLGVVDILAIHTLMTTKMGGEAPGTPQGLSTALAAAGWKSSGSNRRKVFDSDSKTTGWIVHENLYRKIENDTEAWRKDMMRGRQLVTTTKY